jgi:hypothetical protein
MSHSPAPSESCTLLTTHYSLTHSLTHSLLTSPQYVSKVTPTNTQRYRKSITHHMSHSPAPSESGTLLTTHYSLTHSLTHLILTSPQYVSEVTPTNTQRYRKSITHPRYISPALTESLNLHCPHHSLTGKRIQDKANRPVKLRKVIRVGLSLRLHSSDITNPRKKSIPDNS